MSIDKRAFHRFQSPTDLKPAEISHQLHGEGNPLACAYGIRGPSPYGESGGLLPAPYQDREEEIETGRSRLRGEIETPEGSPTGETEAFGVSRNHFYNNGVMKHPHSK